VKSFLAVSLTVTPFEIGRNMKVAVAPGFRRLAMGRGARWRWSFASDNHLLSSSVPMYNVKALPNPCHSNTVMILKGILSGTVRSLA